MYSKIQRYNIHGVLTIIASSRLDLPKISNVYVIPRYTYNIKDVIYKYIKYIHIVYRDDNNNNVLIKK